METEEDPNPGSRQSVVEGLQVNFWLPVGPDPQPGSAPDLPARQKNQTELPVHQMWTKSMSVSKQKNLNIQSIKCGQKACPSPSRKIRTSSPSNVDKKHVSLQAEKPDRTSSLPNVDRKHLGLVCFWHDM